MVLSTYGRGLPTKTGALAVPLAAPDSGRDGRDEAFGEEEEAACISLLIIPAYVNHANVVSDNSPSQLVI